MKKNRTMIVGLIILSLLVLTACGKPKANKETKKNEETEGLAFPIKVTNQDKPLKDGRLDIAMITDSPFKGLLIAELSSDTYDSNLLGPAHEGLFSGDENYGITDEGLVKLDLDIEEKTATLTIQKEAKWSDGVDVTSDDLIFAYELIGHKDYTGVRYTSDLTNIVGIEDYNEGKAETISGITRLDDKTITIEYKEVSPAHLQLGGGVWNSAAPKHYLKDIPVKELESSDEVRVSPLHFGPFVIDKIVPGESVSYRPNEYYYKGKPNLESIVISVSPDTSVTESLKSQQYDLYISMPTGNYDAYKDIPNYEYLGRPEYAYTYFGFKLGKWDDGKGEVQMDENAKMANKNLRKAMGYAVDNDQVGEKFYHGLRSQGTTLIPPVFPIFHDKTQKGYYQDKEKAKELLAEAGYVDVTNDGFVEDPEGNPLVINFASMSGGETAQPLADYYIQEWASIGLNVQLATGRLIDFQSFYDKLKSDDPDIDIYQGAWGTGADPAPSGLYGRNAAFNYSRYASEENDRLLKAINSVDSFDLAYRKQAFNDWQAYAIEEAFVIPSLYRNEILPVHERVTGWDWTGNNRDNWLTVGVTKDSRK